MNLYLRYRNSNLENLNEMVNLVSENLLLRKVIKMMNSDTDKSLELTSKLSRFIHSMLQMFLHFLSR
jgi:hypothetical protein